MPLTTAQAFYVGARRAFHAWFVRFVPEGGMTSTNVQDAIVEAYNNGGGGGEWGDITGTLSDQTDLQAELDAKDAALAAHTGNTSNPHSVTKTQVGLNNVTNDAQTKAAIVPNTAPSAGQVLVGNAGGTAYAPVAVSGDAAVSSAGALTIAAGAVTYAKLQDVSAASLLLGRGSAAGAGDAEEITLGTGLTMAGTTLSASAGGSAFLTGGWYGSSSNSTGTMRLYPRFSGTIVRLTTWAGSAVPSATTVAIKKNGAQIATATITTGGQSGDSGVISGAFTDADYFTADLVSSGAVDVGFSIEMET